MAKKILITGGSRGIGLAIARRFYKEDFEVIICARGTEGLEKAKAEMPNISTYACDISQKEEVLALAEKINEKHGRLDILVNNGGVFLPGAIHEEEDSVFETEMLTNVHSAYYLTKRLLPKMMEAKTGTIINMCSIASVMAYSVGGSYSISKFALLGFSKSIREEMKPHGIRVIAMLPGATYTSSWEGVDIPEERMMPADDIAELAWTSWKMSARTVVEEVLIRPQLGDL